MLDMRGGSWDRETVVSAIHVAHNNPEKAAEYIYSGLPEQAEVEQVPHVRVRGQAANPFDQGEQPATPTSDRSNANPLDLFPQGIPSVGSNASARTLGFSHNSQQVPSEGDFSIAKRKADEHIEREGKRKKKTHKLGTPRPACSWVHFSREFIKEYSASHPESSGLKAATKAASDAWKSMSMEEKAKYTTRAREVWDDYLSTAPPCAPKPRKQSKLVTRCSPGRLFNVLQRLTPEQKDAVKNMGFGSLLGLRCRTLRRSLCLWLLQRFNATRRSLEIRGDCILLSPNDVELVMGLAASGKDVVNSGPDDLITDLRQSYNATNRGISVSLLEERLKVPEAGEEFKRSFVLYALGTLLSPTARLDVSPSFLHFLTNMDVVHQYNWGKFLLDRLVREVTRFRQGKQSAVGGCLLFLQLFYYQSISVEERSLLPVPIPCLSSWGEEEIIEREKRERELGGYGCGEVIYKDKCTGIEGVEHRSQLDRITSGKISTVAVHCSVFEEDGDQTNVPNLPTSNIVRCNEANIVTDSVRTLCRKKEYGCNQTLGYGDDHEETCIFSPCACPLPSCSFLGSSKQLSLHFSSEHWNSGRRFRYNSPLSVSLGMNEQFLVLQAEEDGVVFLLSKGVEAIGNTATITCIGPSSSREKFLYDVVAGSEVSSLKLKSLTKYFPGRIEGFPSMDFLLIPFRFLGSSGQLELEICVWNSPDVGSDCA